LPTAGAPSTPSPDAWKSFPKPAAAWTKLRARHVELPWRAIMGSGDVYRHEYDNVAESFVWRTVRDSLPGLLAVVELELVQHTEREGAAPGLPPPG
jgi:hypothetical protein